METRLRDQREGRPRVPHGALQVQQHRARRKPLRAQGARQHLHAPDEPDHRHRRETHLPSGGRSGDGRRCSCVWHLGLLLRHHQLRAEGRQHRLGAQPVRRHLHHVRRYPADAGHRLQLRRLPGAGQLRRRHQREHPRPLLRNVLQPGARDQRPGGHRQGRPRRRAAADRRRDILDPLPDPDALPRRGRGLPLADEVDRRPRHRYLLEARGRLLHHHN